MTKLIFLLFLSVSLFADFRATKIVSKNLTATSSITVMGSEFSVGGSAFVIRGDRVGIGTASPMAKLHIVDGVILATGTVGAAPIAGGGTRFMWIPEKGAIRAGEVTGAQWNNANIGSYSTAFGLDNTASGGRSVVCGGRVNTASGLDSIVAGGWANTASGRYSFVGGGRENIASGEYGVVLGGRANRAEADYTVVAGYNARATALGSFAFADGTGTGITVGTANTFGARFGGGYWLTGGNVGVHTTAPNSPLHIAGAMSTAIVTVTGATTLTSVHSTVLANATAAPFTITLPSAIGIAGRIYTIKKIDATANAVTISTTAGQTIDGATSYILPTQWKFVKIQTNGSHWFIIGAN